LHGARQQDELKINRLWLDLSWSVHEVSANISEIGQSQFINDMLRVHFHFLQPSE
jgi:hypothetical protein